MIQISKLSRPRHIFLVWLALLLCSCSSWLELSEVEQSAIMESGSKYIGGIAVNKQQEYKVSLDNKLCEAADEGCTVNLEAIAKIRGIDQRKLLLVNAARMPFSTSTLDVELTANQVPKKIGLDSKTGVSGAPKASKAFLDAENERQKIELEALKREEEEKLKLEEKEREKFEDLNN